MWERIKGFMFSPSVTFRASKGETFSDALKYYLPLLVIFSVLFAVVTAAFLRISVVLGFLTDISGMLPETCPVGLLLTIPGQFNMLTLGGGFFIGALIGGIIGILILGIWVHIWAYAFGGRRGLRETMKALMYGSTPFLIFGWIPGLNIIGAIWAILVIPNGLIELQEMYSGRTILALILALVVPMVIMGAIASVIPPTFSYAIKI
ncbi:MAG: YIP1 family protein [Candidatus Methanospirareceae archaeon]